MLPDGIPLRGELSVEQCTSHFPEFPDFIQEKLLGNAEMNRETGKAKVVFRPAVYHFFRQCDFIGLQRTTAMITDRQRTGGVL
jgi:hypothetical protein